MKTQEEQKIIRRQVSRKLETLTAFKEATSGIKSWSKYLRTALGMTISQMSRRMGIAQSTMTESEKGEVEGRLTINKLRKMADALDCDFVYAFVPRSSLQETIEKQAHKKVLKNMKAAQTHMSLEDQSVTLDEKERAKELVEEMIYSKYLWDEE